MGVQRLAATARAVAREGVGAVRLCGKAPSTGRLAADVVLYRALRVSRLPGENASRTIRLRSGDSITYRLNRGDIQSIREVLMDEVYRPPFSMRPRVVVDLGANIGLTSLYYARRFHPTVLVAVEPDPANARLARRNLEPWGASLIEAAIGPEDGVAWFDSSRDSNLGSVGSSQSGSQVQMVSMSTLIETSGIETIDLLKMDIEGGEQALLTGDTAWLSSVNAIVAEFHPSVVDYAGLVQILVDSGFRYIAAGTAWPGSMDAFIRDGVDARETPGSTA